MIRFVCSRFLLGAVFCTVFLSEAAFAWKPAFKLPLKVEMTKGVVYGKIDGKPLTLDLFVPEGGPTPRPAAIYLHGGSWRSGTPAQFHRQAAHMATKGYVGACIRYRLSKKAKFPAALEDSKCAVRWLRANAETYQIDPKRIAAVGGSAGGHLAELVGVIDESFGLEGKGGHEAYSSEVQAVVSFNGVTDLVDCAKKGLLLKAMRQFLGCTYEDNPKRYATASANTHVDKDCPPFLFLHGTKDKTVPFAQSVEMAEKLRALGVDAVVYKAEGAGHGFFNNDPHYTRCLKAMERFLERHLRGKEHTSDGGP